jgi:hypothetical protein
MRRSLTVVLLFTLAIGCGGSDQPGAQGTGGLATATATAATATAKLATTGCSAAGQKSESPQKQGTPEKLGDMRSEIIQAARNCDYDALEKLALDGDESFNYSFGEPNEGDARAPGEYWKSLEADDEPVLETLVRVLRLRPEETTVDGEELYVWPAAAAGDDPSERERSAVEEAFKDENVDEWFTDEGYVGPRAGITEDRDWLFYVTGGD